MQIGSEMATLQEKKPKMAPKNVFFLKTVPPPPYGEIEVPKYPHFGCFWPLLLTRLNFYGSKWLVQVSRI